MIFNSYFDPLFGMLCFFFFLKYLLRPILNQYNLIIIIKYCSLKLIISFQLDIKYNFHNFCIF